MCLSSYNMVSWVKDLLTDIYQALLSFEFMRQFNLFENYSTSIKMKNMTVSRFTGKS